MDISVFPEINFLIAIFIIAGVIMLVTGVSRLYHRKFVTGTGAGLTGLVLVCLSLLLLSFVLNLYTYQRLTHEEAVAELQFREVGHQRYEVELKEASGKIRRLELMGDQWQLDARVMKWEGMANMLGLDSLYRLERISGRYSDIVFERSASRTVYGLSEEAGVDIWDLSQEYKSWLPWVDTIYGSAAYLPMADGASFKVNLSTTGLVARPANEIAKESVKNWH
jgi:hypothetical protein